jgi:hypothetical protein
MDLSGIPNSILYHNNRVLTLFSMVKQIFKSFKTGPLSHIHYRRIYFQLSSSPRPMDYGNEGDS